MAKDTWHGQTFQIDLNANKNNWKSLTSHITVTENAYPNIGSRIVHSGADIAMTKFSLLYQLEQMTQIESEYKMLPTKEIFDKNT